MPQEAFLSLLKTWQPDQVGPQESVLAWEASDQARDSRVLGPLGQVEQMQRVLPWLAFSNNRITGCILNMN